MELSDGFLFQAANISQCDEIFALESQAFPKDEAATFESILMRCKEAGDFFFVLMHESVVIGFINGTLSEGEEIKHEAMTEHVETGSTLVIHSVTISSEYRRRGLAKCILNLYVQRLLNDPVKRVRCILLLAKEYLLDFYVSSGFTVRRESSVQHGVDTWFELALDLNEARSA